MHGMEFLCIVELPTHFSKEDRKKNTLLYTSYQPYICRASLKMVAMFELRLWAVLRETHLVFSGPLLSRHGKGKERKSKEKPCVSNTLQPLLHVDLTCKTYHTLLSIVSPCQGAEGCPLTCLIKTATSVGKKKPCGEKKKHVKFHLSRLLWESDWS